MGYGAAGLGQGAREAGMGIGQALMGAAFTVEDRQNTIDAKRDQKRRDNEEKAFRQARLALDQNRAKEEKHRYEADRKREEERYREEAAREDAEAAHRGVRRVDHIQIKGDPTNVGEALMMETEPHYQYTPALDQTLAPSVTEEMGAVYDASREMGGMMPPGYRMPAGEASEPAATIRTGGRDFGNTPAGADSALVWAAELSRANEGVVPERMRNDPNDTEGLQSVDPMNPKDNDEPGFIRRGLRKLGIGKQEKMGSMERKLRELMARTQADPELSPDEKAATIAEIQRRLQSM